MCARAQRRKTEGLSDASITSLAREAATAAGGVFLSLKSSARARERKEGDAVSDRDVVRATPFAAANETTIGESKTLQKKVRERAPQKQ